MRDLRAWMDAEGLDAEGMASAVIGRRYDCEPELTAELRDRVWFRGQAVRLIREVLAGKAPGPEHEEILTLAGVPQVLDLGV